MIMGDKHPDETTIELYVLGSSPENEDMVWLEAHLAQCRSCGELHAAIREFYRDLDLETGPGGAPASGLPIPTRHPDSHLRHVPGKRSGDRLPAGRMVETAFPIRMARWIVKHPVISTTTGLGAFGLMILFLLPGPGIFTARRDTNPVNYRVEGVMVSIVNRADSVLMTERVSKSYAAELVNQDDTHSRTAVRILFVDVDGNGTNEFLQVRNPGRPVDIPVSDLLLRSPEKEIPLWRYEPVRRFSFPGKTEGNAPDFLIRTIDAGDYDRDGAMEVYVISVHTHFPSTLARLDAATGAEQGLFVHIGHINIMRAADLDGDGVSELIIGGRNNAYRHAFVAVLDPRHISGRGPATEPYIPDGIPPAAIRSYVLFPRTIVGAGIDDGELSEHVAGIDVNRAENYVRVTVDEYNSTPVHASYTVVFDQAMNPINFQTGSEFDTLADSLDRRGLLPVPVDADYQRSFLTQLLYLRGEEWTTRPLSTRFGQHPDSTRIR